MNALTSPLPPVAPPWPPPLSPANCTSLTITEEHDLELVTSQVFACSIATIVASIY